jgi:hypothetical protein
VSGALGKWSGEWRDSARGWVEVEGGIWRGEKEVRNLRGTLRDDLAFASDFAEINLVVRLVWFG